MEREREREGGGGGGGGGRGERKRGRGWTFCTIQYYAIIGEQAAAFPRVQPPWSSPQSHEDERNERHLQSQS